MTGASTKLSKKAHPWLGIRRRLKELPGAVLAMLSPAERRRLQKIVKHRKIQRDELKRGQGKV